MEIKCTICKGKADFSDAYLCVKKVSETKTSGNKVTTFVDERAHNADIYGVCRECVEKDRVRHSKPSIALLIFLAVMILLMIMGPFFIAGSEGKKDDIIGGIVFFTLFALLFLSLGIVVIRKANRIRNQTPESYFEQEKTRITTLGLPDTLHENGHTYSLSYYRLYDSGEEYSGDDKVVASVVQFGKSVAHLLPEARVSAAQSQIHHN